MKLRFEVERNCGRENSFGAVGERKTVMLQVNISLPDEVLGGEESQYGSFEFYDIEEGGEQFYAEGGLWFTGGSLTDYDGIFSLSDFIVDAIEGEGFDVSEMRELLSR